MIEDIHTCLLNKKETCLRLFVSIMTSVIALLVAESSIAYDLGKDIKQRHERRYPFENSTENPGGDDGKNQTKSYP